MKNPKVVKGVHAPSHTSTFNEKDADNLDERLFLGNTHPAPSKTMSRRQFSKIADQVAESDHYMRNEPIPYGLELFPNEWRMRYSDLYYPAAPAGGVFIDTPTAPWDVKACERKYEAYASKGVRYTYIKSGDSPADVSMRLYRTLPAGLKKDSE